jgi:hypothetical protein
MEHIHDMMPLTLIDNRQKQKQKQLQTQHSHSESNNHYIRITECPTDPCAIYYTDAISQSILVVCKNPKHTDVDADIEKVKGMDEVTNQPNPQPAIIDRNYNVYTVQVLQEAM